MKKRFFYFIAFLCLFSNGNLYSQNPEKVEQLIYSILAYDGKDYSGTFCKEDSDTIYLLADSPSFMTLKKTLVFYWPITNEWKTDPEILDVPMDGVLEIKGENNFNEILRQRDYTYYNIQGYYEKNWKVATDQNAHSEWNRYMEMVSNYWSEYSKYRIQKTKYDRKLDELLSDITRLREQGKDYSILLSTFENLEEPIEPEIPDYYIIPPVEVQKGFVIDLPVGEYNIQARDSNGRIFSGSQKKLIIFKSRRENGIGYDIIPGDQWTRSVESNTASSVLYVNGKTDLYLRPFFQNEYQDLYYAKLKNNNGRGNPNIFRWQKIQQIPDTVIELKSNNIKGSELIKEEDFIVEQISNSSLGYEIVKYEPEGKHSNRKPSLRAFYIPIKDKDKCFSIMLIDGKGNYLSGGERQIRIIDPPLLTGLFLMLASLPLLFMLAIIVYRYRRQS